MSIKKNVKKNLEISAKCLGVDKVNGAMFNVLFAVQANESAENLINTFYQLKKKFCKDSNVKPDMKLWVDSFVESLNLQMKKREEK